MITHVKCARDSENGLTDYQLGIDHSDKFVTFEFVCENYGVQWYVSMSPAEAKSIAAALVHYAERAQKYRDAEEEM